MAEITRERVLAELTRRLADCMQPVAIAETADVVMELFVGRAEAFERPMIHEDDIGNRWVYEHCCRCKRRTVVSFVVDDDVWAAAHEEYLRLCTTCFDELADQKDVRYVFREIRVTSWSESLFGEWPHFDEPCAQCAGRATTAAIIERRLADPDALRAAGYTPESVKAAVRAHDLNLLEHSGVFSTREPS